MMMMVVMVWIKIRMVRVHMITVRSAEVMMILTQMVIVKT